MTPDDGNAPFLCHLSFGHSPHPIRRVFGAMVGMVGCAVPARGVAGGTNRRATLAFEAQQPLWGGMLSPTSLIFSATWPFGRLRQTRRTGQESKLGYSSLTRRAEE